MTELEKGKRSRSTELSGGEGFTYEDTVVAYYLTALLHEEGAAGISGRISRVAVQQASQGEPLDDLVVDADLFGEPRRLSLQVKRQLTISAAESNTDFRELIANSLSTRAQPGFRVGVDRYGFIARTVGDERLNSCSVSSRGLKQALLERSLPPDLAPVKRAKPTSIFATSFKR